jgi:hypothetical protein
MKRALVEMQEKEKTLLVEEKSTPRGVQTGSVS